MSGRRVLVTGGTGFLGRAVVRTLTDRGDQPVILSRTARPDGLTVDLADAEQVPTALAGERFDAVCHLAALTRARDSVHDPLAFWTANVTGT